MNPASAPRSILITGASSGLGAALARHYATTGSRLVLVGRHEPRLAAVADDCRRAGAHSRHDTDAGRNLIVADGAMPLDLVIANAGVSAGTLGGREQRTGAAFRHQCRWRRQHRAAGSRGDAQTRCGQTLQFVAARGPAHPTVPAKLPSSFGAACAEPTRRVFTVICRLCRNGNDRKVDFLVYMMRRPKGRAHIARGCAQPAAHAFPPLYAALC
jgi:hypothetical protein